MADVSMKLDPHSERELQRAIQRLANIAGKTAEEVITSQARLFCADLAGITKPIGKGAAPGQKLKTRIKDKIDDIYWTVGQSVEMLKSSGAGGQAVAHQFQRSMRKRNYAQAAAIFTRHIGGSRWSVGPFDAGALHREYRFKRRIGERLIVTDKPAIARYRSEIQKRAGYAKGGFAAAARQLGGARGIPGYATRQNSPGRGIVQKAQNSLSVIIENSVRGIKAAFDANQETIALNMRKGKIEKLIVRIMRNKTRKISRSLK